MDKDIRVIKNMSHPYLHEIIKSALIYDSQKVFSEFVLSDGKTKLKNWKLIESRQEYILCSHTKHRIRYEFKYGNPENIKYKICDAVWTMEWLKDLHEGGELQKNYTHIIHEVKTGNANVFEIYKQYAGMVYENATYDSSDRRRITGNVCGLDFLWIWGWKDLLDFSIPDNENPEIVKKFNIAFKQRRVRVLSLSLIVPIVNNALNKILF